MLNDQTQDNSLSPVSIKRQITRSVAVMPSPRLAQVLGMFDIEPPQHSGQTWEVDLQLPAKWNVGVIVGPSGSGKTTLAGELFGSQLAGSFSWNTSHSIVDGFPRSLSIKTVIDLLCSVGFSSPPAWVRPFHCLSNGQQFRVTLARTLAESMVDRQLRVVDEYSSVVDRTVAKIGSAAVARTVRKNQLRFIAVTCHYDVLDWLEPDWVYDLADGSVRSIAEQDSDREMLRRLYQRPKIELEIVQTDYSTWKRFKSHHYLSAELHPSSACYIGLVNNQPAVFTAVLFFPHASRSGWREHRTVCLPDYQGIGIGNAMSEFIASIYRATGKPYFSTTSHPAMILHRAKSPSWKMIRSPGMTSPRKRTKVMRKTTAIDRMTGGFEYVGPPRWEDAHMFDLV